MPEPSTVLCTYGIYRFEFWYLIFDRIQLRLLTLHYDLQTRRRIKTLRQSDIPCLSLHMIDNYLVTQDKSGLVKFWQYTDGDFKCIYCKDFNHLSFCKISILKRDIPYLAVPQSGSIIDIYSVKEGIPIACGSLQCRDLNCKKLGDVMVLKIILVDCVEFLAAMYEAGALILWNISSKSITSTNQLTSDTPMCFDFDSDQMQGVCGTSGDNILVFKMNTEGDILRKMAIRIKNPGTASLCIRPDKKILAAGCWDGKIRIFSWKNLKLLVVLECHQESVLNVCFSNHVSENRRRNYLLAGGSGDNRVSLWNIYN